MAEQESRNVPFRVAFTQKRRRPTFSASSETGQLSLEYARSPHCVLVRFFTESMSLTPVPTRRRNPPHQPMQDAPSERDGTIPPQPHHERESPTILRRHIYPGSSVTMTASGAHRPDALATV